MQEINDNSLKICIVTLFPEFFDSPSNTSMMKRGIESGEVTLDFVQIRDFSTDKHRRVDDAPYGGGCGLVMKVEPLAAAIQFASRKYPGARRILMSPQGRPFQQKVAAELARERNGIILICGHYEGVDERVHAYIDDEISIGDYILTGGELAALLISDAVMRLHDGVLGNQECPKNDSFSDELLEYPQYTRPWDYNGDCVPEILRSGNHAEIDKWRRNESLKRTFLRRPDLIVRIWHSLSEKEHAFLRSISPEKWTELQKNVDNISI